MNTKRYYSTKKDALRALREAKKVSVLCGGWRAFDNSKLSKSPRRQWWIGTEVEFIHK